MLVQCPACDRHFDVPKDALKPDGRNLKCAGCGHLFFQTVPESAYEDTKTPVKIAEDVVGTEPLFQPREDSEQEDETLTLSQTKSDERATSSEELKENDLDDDRELKELLNDAESEQQQAPGKNGASLEEISMDEDDVTLLSTPEADEWATTMEELKEIDLENDPELHALEETDEASDQETLLAENSADAASHFEEPDQDSWSEEEDPWPDEENDPEENEADLLLSEIDQDDLAIALPEEEEEEVLPEKELHINLPEEEEEEVLPEKELYIDLPEKNEEILKEKASPEKQILPAVSPILAKTLPQTDGELMDKGRWDNLKNTSKKVWALAALLLLTLTYGLVSQTEWGTVALINARSSYRLLSLESQWRNHAVGGLLLIQGEVENNSRSSAPPLVYISLMDKNNHVLLAAQSIPGRVVDTKILDDTGQQAIREIVSLQGQGRTPAELVWKGTTMPFQAVFVNPPEEAAHFQVDFK